MSFDYLNEAFKKLSLLNEETFDTSLNGLNQFSDFMQNDYADEVVKVIDADAEVEDNLKDSYIGKVIINCNVCHSHLFEDKDNIIIDDEGLVNPEKQCPYCGETAGFTIVGEITPFEQKIETADNVENTPTVDVKVEDEQDSVTESTWSEREHRSNLERKKKMEFIQQQGLIDDLHDEIFDECKTVTRFYSDGSYWTVSPAYSDYTDVEIKTDIKKVSQLIHEYYKLAIKNSTLESKGDDLTEDINNVNVETDDSVVNVHTEEGGKVTVSTEPKQQETTSDETISPLSDETIDEIQSSNDLTNDNSETAEEDNVDMDIEEVDEAAIDELGESYLKEVYQNVDSFKTTNVSGDDTHLVVEGVIKFKSGVSKKTGFIFEAYSATKSGNVKFVGKNEHFSRGSKSFILAGRVSNKKLISESLTYNYRAKDMNGKSTRIYGTVNKKNKGGNLFNGI